MARRQVRLMNASVESSAIPRREKANERLSRRIERRPVISPPEIRSGRGMSEAEQLTALARLDALLERNRIEYWLFGGWAVDFHAGSVTRPHDDLDLAVWLKDRDRVAALLAEEGWNHAPEEGEDGYTGYERCAVRLELAFLARDESGQIYTPLREGRAAWPTGAFENDLAELRGARARIISLQALKADKSEAHDDPRVAAKDRADSAILSHLQSG
jgi:hypothetical protein